MAIWTATTWEWVSDGVVEDWRWCVSELDAATAAEARDEWQAGGLEVPGPISSEAQMRTWTDWSATRTRQATRRPMGVQKIVLDTIPTSA